MSDVLDSLTRDAALLELMAKFSRIDDHRAAQIAQLNTELAEVRDDLVALSNRIEAVTRGIVRGAGLHSVES